MGRNLTRIQPTDHGIVLLLPVAVVHTGHRNCALPPSNKVTSRGSDRSRGFIFFECQAGKSKRLWMLAGSLDGCRVAIAVERRRIDEEIDTRELETIDLRFEQSASRKDGLHLDSCPRGQCHSATQPALLLVVVGGSPWMMPTSGADSAISKKHDGY
jgi:hypothetical protein